MRPNRATAEDADLSTGLADRVGQIDRLLPQTQCRRCGFQGCRPYAQAIAAGLAPINRCPPGGNATVAALAGLLDTAIVALDPECGAVQPPRVASIDNSVCIGCTRCIAACPVDAIVGAPRHQHHVLADRCTGCDLCLPPCPVDCISMKVIAQDWSEAAARQGRRNHRARLDRLAAASAEPAEQARLAGANRDPLLVLSAPEEKARRLAKILARARGGRAR